MKPIWHVKRWKKQEKVATHPESAERPVLASLQGERRALHIFVTMRMCTCACVTVNDHM
jgi:hypothetical protein